MAAALHRPMSVCADPAWTQLDPSWTQLEQARLAWAGPDLAAQGTRPCAPKKINFRSRLGLAWTGLALGLTAQLGCQAQGQPSCAQF